MELLPTDVLRQGSLCITNWELVESVGGYSENVSSGAKLDTNNLKLRTYRAENCPENRQKAPSQIYYVRQLTSEDYRNSEAFYYLYRRLEREKDALRKFVDGAPGFISMWQYSQQPETWFLVMQEVPGEMILKYQTQGGRSSAKKDEVVRESFKLLNKMHTQCIWHRDLKPEHIIVDQHDTGVKIHFIDFGLAHCGQTVNFAAGGFWFWSDFFAPPEQYGIDAKKIDQISEKSDVFALSSTFFYWYTGKHYTAFVDPEKYYKLVVSQNDFSQTKAALIEREFKQKILKELNKHHVAHNIIDILIKGLELDENKRPSTGELLSIQDNANSYINTNQTDVRTMLAGIKSLIPSMHFLSNIPWKESLESLILYSMNIDLLTGMLSSIWIWAIFTYFTSGWPDQTGVVASIVWFCLFSIFTYLGFPSFFIGCVLGIYTYVSCLLPAVNQTGKLIYLSLGLVAAGCIFTAFIPSPLKKYPDFQRSILWICLLFFLPQFAYVLLPLAPIIYVLLTKNTRANFIFVGLARVVAAMGALWWGIKMHPWLTGSEAQVMGYSVLHTTITSDSLNMALFIMIDIGVWVGIAILSNILLRRVVIKPELWALGVGFVSLAIITLLVMILLHLEIDFVAVVFSSFICVIFSLLVVEMPIYLRRMIDKVLE